MSPLEIATSACGLLAMTDFQYCACLGLMVVESEGVHRLIPDEKVGE